jgi:hypothetical protein
MRSDMDKNTFTNKGEKDMKFKKLIQNKYVNRKLKRRC